ncbi:MAG TPA: alpha-L-rhamnosidase C-terminal domain-containing protein, partial [Microlunatus sp.]|nr:alpha-L-rhamnosidase C-terminal domain-containing protein [Microlunatus sp.]
VGWRTDGDELELEVHLPEGVEAEVDLPGAPRTLDPGDHVLRVPPPTGSMISSNRQETRR